MLYPLSYEGGGLYVQVSNVEHLGGARRGERRFVPRPGGAGLGADGVDRSEWWGLFRLDADASVVLLSL